MISRAKPVLERIADVASVTRMPESGESDDQTTGRHGTSTRAETAVPLSTQTKRLPAVTVGTPIRPVHSGN
jgi:hypothetical protein